MSTAETLRQARAIIARDGWCPRGHVSGWPISIRGAISLVCGFDYDAYQTACKAVSAVLGQPLGGIHSFETDDKRTVEQVNAVLDKAIQEAKQ
jgi:hypothetical protein